MHVGLGRFRRALVDVRPHRAARAGNEGPGLWQLLPGLTAGDFFWIFSRIPVDLS